MLEFKMQQQSQVAWINPSQVCAVTKHEQMSGRSPKTGCAVLLSGGQILNLQDSDDQVAARLRDALHRPQSQSESSSAASATSSVSADLHDRS